MLQFFQGNSQASYIDAAESLQVARQKISRKVSRFIEGGKMIRNEWGLIVVSAAVWVPEVA